MVTESAPCDIPYDAGSPQSSLQCVPNFAGDSTNPANKEEDVISIVPPNFLCRKMAVKETPAEFIFKVNMAFFQALGTEKTDNLLDLQ